MINISAKKLFKKQTFKFPLQPFQMFVRECIAAMSVTVWLGVYGSVYVCVRVFVC